MFGFGDCHIRGSEAAMARDEACTFTGAMAYGVQRAEVNFLGGHQIDHAVAKLPPQAQLAVMTTTARKMSEYFPPKSPELTAKLDASFEATFGSGLGKKHLVVTPAPIPKFEI
jgi:hypothetical protein